MAMLAERKQKVKWCLNPRGNDWAKDENKFGQKMLEKMGWQPGMGLGAKGQGRTDFVRLQIKNDTKGLGNKEKFDEVWTRQQENFDSLLAQLNGSDKNDSLEDAMNIPSLEDKSKMSKARVHYHKFTRGKDVSKYSSKDLSCIIGIGKKPSENSSDLVTEVSNSMYDYFRTKSIRKKETSTMEENDYDIEAPEMINNVDEAENVSDHCESNKKKSKRAKRKALDCDDEQESLKTVVVEENISDEHNTLKAGLLEESVIPPKKKKKKKIKSIENEEIGANDGNMSGVILEEINEVDDLKNGIEESRSHEEDAFETDVIEDNIIPLKKKKKRKRKSIENEEMGDNDENRLDIVNEEIEVKPLEENINNGIEDKSLKKKKKKRHKNKENQLEDH